MYDIHLLEEEIKKKVAKDFFSTYDTTENIGAIDFAVALNQPANELKLCDKQYFLWAEAKRGRNQDIQHSLVQLIITIGKARTFNSYLPPYFIGAFDAEKIAFLEYSKIQDIFYQNDFNWNVTPSDHETKEFAQVLHRVQEILDQTGETPLLYKFKEDRDLLRNFIRRNFKPDNAGTHKVRVTFNNMTHIFNRWHEEVLPTIKVDWKVFEKENILACDFFLADVLSKNNQTLSDSMKVLLRDRVYKFKNFDATFGEMEGTIEFTDKQKAHTTFWSRYERPPQKKHREEMRERRDLLVPPDRRERKGAFFTPSQWVDLSQKYLADTLGEDWQDKYYIWDCCAGTGNLLYGLHNKPYIFASTLDDADVRQMKENCANLLPEHIFQFDFLNDDLQSDKVPADLRRILQSEEDRKKLVIYINPPYAEAASKETIVGKGEHKTNVAVNMATYTKYLPEIGIAGRELFAQFFIRIYKEIPSCTLAEFSTLKILQAPNFSDFRSVFKAKLLSLFLVPANTFDNVKGQFPIGFHIWDLNTPHIFTQFDANVYDKKAHFVGKKRVELSIESRTINDWMIETRKYQNNGNIGFMSCLGCDFQHNNLVFIMSDKSIMAHPRGSWITTHNVKEVAIYYAVRHVIEATWLNDRDQFLYPNDGWKEDLMFQSDCLAYTMFNNNIQSKHGTNHWIPFKESEVGAHGIYESHFMLDYLAGKVQATENTLFEDSQQVVQPKPIIFTSAAKAVMEAGRKLYAYYHQQENSNPNASFYDIRAHFQGFDAKGKMNTKCDDQQYMQLLSDLRRELKVLARQIEPKVYEYGFLKGQMTVTQETSLDFGE